MIPLGILASAHVPASGATPGLTYIGTAASSANSATFTFTSVPLGVTDANALTIIVTMIRGTTSTTRTATVTVGGGAATKQREQGNSGWFSGVGIHDIATPAATADVVVTLSNAAQAGCSIFVYQIIGASSLPALITSNSGTSTNTVPLTMPSGGGFVIAGASNDASAAGVTSSWTVLTKDAGEQVAFIHRTVGSTDYGSSGTFSPTVNWSTTTAHNIAAAAYTRG